jgi:SAM-dependent methyltransferase
MTPVTGPRKPDNGPVIFQSSGCPLCGSKVYRWRGKPRHIDALFSGVLSPGETNAGIVQCRSCGLFYTEPFPRFSDDLLRRMYSGENDYFREMTARMEHIVHRANPVRRLTAIEKHAARPVRRFLEIGCGEGFALEAARKRGWEVYGQEVSPGFAAIARERSGAEIMVGQITESSFPAESFDCIYIDSVLEHVADPMEFMKILCSFLAPGGVVYLTMPNEDSWFHAVVDAVLRLAGSRSTCRLMPFAPPYHVLGFSEKSLRYAAEKSGFGVRFLGRKYSYNHIRRLKGGFSVTGTIKRSLMGALYLLSDWAGNGTNMEALLSKS